MSQPISACEFFIVLLSFSLHVSFCCQVCVALSVGRLLPLMWKTMLVSWNTQNSLNQMWNISFIIIIIFTLVDTGYETSTEMVSESNVYLVATATKIYLNLLFLDKAIFLQFTLVLYQRHINTNRFNIQHGTLVHGTVVVSLYTDNTIWYIYLDFIAFIYAFASTIDFIVYHCRTIWEWILNYYVCSFFLISYHV